MKLQLQINSLEALEKLIGGNADAELEIRNNIVQEFTKKHLKAIVNDGLFAKKFEELKSDVEKSFRKKVEEGIGEIKSSYYDKNYDKRFVPTPEFEKEIKKSVESAINETLRSVIESKFDNKVRGVLEQQIDYYITNVFVTNFNKMIKDRVELAFKQYIGGVLGKDELKFEVKVAS